MTDLTLVSDFPPWSIDYVISVEAPIAVTEQKGYRRQENYAKRKITKAAVSRRLTGIELPFWEWFVRDKINSGQLSFTDKYKNGGGVQTGETRLLTNYSVETNGKNHTVKCEVEIRGIS